jgi:hypothetical protein
VKKLAVVNVTKKVTSKEMLGHQNDYQHTVNDMIANRGYELT